MRRVSRFLFISYFVSIFNLSMKKLSIGIVGLPNVGKSTLFKLLTKQEVNIANYPFCTIDPNIGIVSVPDERLNRLATLSESKKIVPAIVEFYDIAGLVKGASAGEGLGNQFLSHIREVNAIVMVVRCFGGTEITHVENSVDPVRDMGIINAELALKDLETVEKRLVSLGAEARGGKKEAIEALPILQKVKDALMASGTIHEYADEPEVRSLQLLTMKRQICLLNGDESDVPENLVAELTQKRIAYVVANVGDEASSQDALHALIREAYATLNLISFFTTGEDETRAWTIRRGAKAPEAAGTIHGDFEQKFIRAEVVTTDALLEAGSWTQAKAKGKMRLEGKEYVVVDGDVMVIRHG